MAQRQLNIRSDEAAERAARLARQLHKTTTEVVVEALRSYEAAAASQGDGRLTPEQRRRSDAILQAAEEFRRHVKPDADWDETWMYDEGAAEMIAIDASAIVAIAKDEDDRQQLRDAIAGSRCVIGAPSLLEVKIVLASVAEANAVDRLLQGIGVGREIEPVDFTPSMADVAALAFRTFGKGRGHPAQLNFGDCMAYAVAKVHGVPLLYKGEDFSRTDIPSALA